MRELWGGKAVLSRKNDGLGVVEAWLGRVVLIAVAGGLDMLTAPLLDDAIHAALRKQPTAMIVDLTRVVFLAAAAMNLLVATHHEITPTTRFGVVADGPGTSRPMKIIGIDTSLPSTEPSVTRWPTVRPSPAPQPCGSFSTVAASHCSVAETPAPAASSSASPAPVTPPRGCFASARRYRC